MEQINCLECGAEPATHGHVCAVCYTRAMEEAHRAFYGPEETTNGN